MMMSPVCIDQLISACPSTADVNFVHLIQGLSARFLTEKLIIFQLSLIGSWRDLLRHVHKLSHFMLLLPLSTSFPFTCRLLWKMKALTFVQAFVSKCSVNFLLIPLSFHSYSLSFLLFVSPGKENKSPIVYIQVS